MEQKNFKKISKKGNLLIIRETVWPTFRLKGEISILSVVAEYKSKAASFHLPVASNFSHVLASASMDMHFIVNL